MKRPILTALVVGLVMFSTTPGSAFADYGAEAKNYAAAVEYRDRVCETPSRTCIAANNLVDAAGQDLEDCLRSISY